MNFPYKNQVFTALITSSALIGANTVASNITKRNSLSNTETKTSSHIQTNTQSSIKANTLRGERAEPAAKKALSGGVTKTAVHPAIHEQVAPKTWGQRHPMMKAAAIDGGIGAAAGGATGLITGRGIVRGAAIGGIAGAGIGAGRKTKIASRHPIARDTLTGTAAGAALGMAAGGRTGEGALLGGAVGAGISLWKHRKDL